MNRKTLQLILVLLLLLLVGYLIKNNQKGTIDRGLRDFAVEDTSLIDKIFLVDKQNNSILLERKQGYWTVNKSSVARQDLVNIMLKTLLRIRVKEPVPKAAKENIIKNLAVKSTKVEIYEHSKLKKTFFVGGPTIDNYGTYMILKNSNVPFIMEIPGFRGYLSTRFSTREIDWKSQKVFNIKLDEIKSIVFENKKDINESFKVVVNRDIELYDYQNSKVNKFDTTLVVQFLKEFSNKNFSKYIEDVPKKWQDSIIESTPMYIINVELIDGKKQIIKAYNKPGWGKIDFFGKELKSDPDNFFLLLNSNELVYAQYFSFNSIFKKLSYFTKPNKK
jgi:hypothetical protein